MSAVLSSLAVAWLGTFLVHSSVLVLAVWCLSRCMSNRGRHEQEVLWRCALLGALLSASLQTAWGRDPLGHSLVLPAAAHRDAPVVSASNPVRIEAPGWIPAPAVSARLPAKTPPVPIAAASTSRVFGHPASRHEGVRGSWLVLFLLVPGSLATLWSLGRASCCVRRRSRDSRVIRSGPAWNMLEELRKAAGLKRRVQLAVSEGWSVPVVFGLWRPQIGLPPAALERLSAKELRCVFAHEVAHLKRRDGGWLWVRHVVCTLFFFQPLLRLVSGRLRELAELDCDDWAAQQVGDRWAVASTLTKVASWLTNARTASQLAMAQPGLGLQVRVERLLEPGPRSPSRPSRGQRWVLAVAVLVGVTLVPGFSRPSSAMDKAMDRVIDGAPNNVLYAPRSEAGFAPFVAVNAVPQAWQQTLQEIHALGGELAALRQDVRVTSSSREVELTLRALESREHALRAIAGRVSAGLARRSNSRQESGLSKLLDQEVVK